MVQSNTFGPKHFRNWRFDIILSEIILPSSEETAVVMHIFDGEVADRT